MWILRRFLGLCVLIAISAACGRPEASAGRPDEFAAPAGSGQPNLAVAADGSLLLTWHEPSSEGRFALRFSVHRDGRWSPARTIRESASFFVNWADFPSMVELPSGEWAVHWLQKVPGHTYAYHVNVAFSRDRGTTWSEPVVPHRDASPTEHGFVSMLPWLDGALGLVWLDGRAMSTADGGGEAAGDMGLRFTTLPPTGTRGEDVLLDGRVCECCQTALARSRAAYIVAYRDRTAEEIRDISIVRYTQGEWSAPVRAVQDGWRFPGCPVNGPALAVGRTADREDAVALAWYSEGAGHPAVFVAFSVDGGHNFGAPIRVDDGDPLGRVDLELLDDGAAVVVWLEAGKDEGSVRARRVASSGRRGRSHAVAEVSAARASGFPRLARRGADSLWFAWTEPGELGGVRVAARAVPW